MCTKPRTFLRSLIRMRQSPRLERARQRAAESAKRIADQKLLIAALRAQGVDATMAARKLDDMKVEHRALLQQLAQEQSRS